MTELGAYLAKKSASKAEISKKTGISKSRINELTLNPSTQLRVWKVGHGASGGRADIMVKDKSWKIKIPY